VLKLDDLLLKPNFLIEKSNVLTLLKSKRKWTIQEQRFLVSYLSKINPRDKTTKRVRYSLDSFFDLFDLGEEYRKPARLKKAAEKLISHVQIEYIPGEGFCFNMRSFLLFNVFDTGIDSKGNYYVEIEAHDDAMDLMFDLDKYFSYRLEHVLKLSSVGQFRLYEILKHHEFMGGVRLTLDQIREWVCGDKTVYPDYKVLSRDVLKKYQQIINKTTDITFTYKPIRRGMNMVGGKPTVAVEFDIRKKKDNRQMSLFDPVAKGIDVEKDESEDE